MIQKGKYKLLLKDNINQAVGVLRKGGIVIYPTDTAFGIGCRIDDEKAVGRLFKIRNRPLNQPVPVLVDSINMAKKYFASSLPDNVRHLMEKYWPGALTIVYYCQLTKVLSLVRGNSETLGVRMPNHKITSSLIKGIGVPLLGPSANFHGEKTPYTVQDLDINLIDLVDCVVSGSCQTGNVSTVVDCTRNPCEILRQGAVKLENHDML